VSTHEGKENPRFVEAEQFEYVSAKSIHNLANGHVFVFQIVYVLVFSVVLWWVFQVV